MHLPLRFKGSIVGCGLWALSPCGILSQTAEPDLSASPKYLHALTSALIQQTHWGDRTRSSHKAHHDVRRQLCAPSRFFSALPSGHVGHLKPHESIKEQLNNWRLWERAHLSKTCLQLALLFPVIGFDLHHEFVLMAHNYVTLAAQAECCMLADPLRQLWNSGATLGCCYFKRLDTTHTFTAFTSSVLHFEQDPQHCVASATAPVHAASEY